MIRAKCLKCLRIYEDYASDVCLACGGTIFRETDVPKEEEDEPEAGTTG